MNELKEIKELKEHSLISLLSLKSFISFKHKKNATTISKRAFTDVGWLDRLPHHKFKMQNLEFKIQIDFVRFVILREERPKDLYCGCLTE